MELYVNTKNKPLFKVDHWKWRSCLIRQFYKPIEQEYIDAIIENTKKVLLRLHESNLNQKRKKIVWDLANSFEYLSCFRLSLLLSDQRHAHNYFSMMLNHVFSVSKFSIDSKRFRSFLSPRVSKHQEDRFSQFCFRIRYSRWWKL